MGIAVKLDEDLPASVAVPLERAGHQVKTVFGQGWGGLKDSALWPRVVAEAMVLITAD